MASRISYIMSAIDDIKCKLTKLGSLHEHELDKTISALQSNLPLIL